MNYLLVVISFLFIPVQSQLSDYKKILQEGLQLEDQGQYEEALDVWASALTELETPSLTIGREYIRLVTEQHIRTHYENASSIYLWGLTSENVLCDIDALEQELRMLEPLVDQNEYRQWYNLLQEKKVDVFQKIHLFWQNSDPTPGTLYNERLLEHWERIAYVRENYNRQDAPPYGTDERGIEYVRFGQPDRIHSGYLYLSRGTVYSECSSLPGCNPEAMANVVMNLDTNPYYEIWIYAQPSKDMQYNLVLIFGEKSLSGFRKVDTIEDFIPSGAFTLSKRYNNSSPVTGTNSPGDLFTPGMIMQWLYYQQLATVDFFFADRFNDLAFEWDGDPTDPGKGKFQGQVQEQRSEMLTMENLNRAPKELSTYEKIVSTIPIEAFHYRLLDKENQPITITFLESQPRHVFLNDLAFNEEVLFSDEKTMADEAFAFYELIHGLRIIGAAGETQSSARQPVELILDFKEGIPSSSVFKIPYREKTQQIILYAELHNRHTGSRPRFETAFPSSLRGVSKIKESIPKPLSSDPNTLEMGDLILGYEMRSDSREDILFPFVVANNKEIPEGEELAVHLEVYNLRRGEDGLTSFQIEYEILPVRQMEWLRRKEYETSLTLNMETTGRQYVENLEILTRDLEPGPYKLRFTTIDNINRQQVTREIEFRVVENMKQNEQLPEDG